MGKRGTTDLAPAIRSAFIKGFKQYCDNGGKKKNGIKITFSDAMADLIDEQGLLTVLSTVSKFTVRESAVKGNVQHDHNHKHTHESVSESAEWVAGLLGTATDSEAKKPRPN